jgi:phosphatidate cytidylyltransferase
VLLRDLDSDGYWLLLAVLGTWATDTFAYATGKLIGRHKMAPRISPGKTWEGTVGGLVGGFAAVVALNWPLDLPMTFGEAALIGALLPAAAIIADLGESMIKRGAGVKDTSDLVPGHGGFLDRLDSLLFTVPLVYYVAIWVVLD